MKVHLAQWDSQENFSLVDKYYKLDDVPAFKTMLTKICDSARGEIVFRPNIIRLACSILANPEIVNKRSYLDLTCCLLENPSYFITFTEEL